MYIECLVMLRYFDICSGFGNNNKIHNNVNKVCILKLLISGFWFSSGMLHDCI